MCSLKAGAAFKYSQGQTTVIDEMNETSLGSQALQLEVSQH